MSKLLEKHIHDSLMTYLVKFNFLHENQSGFRPSHSCKTALICMISKWLERINKVSLIGTVMSPMTDFKKAFDLVDHNVLLKKLKHYKLSHETLTWFASYLGERKLDVSLNNDFLKMKLLLMVSHRALFWALYFFSCLLMTCPCILILLILIFMRTTHFML